MIPELELGLDHEHALLRDVAGPESGIGPIGESGQRDLDEAGLALALERLLEADILLVEGVGPQATYRFKHALIQDAAYESFLKSRRQALHRRTIMRHARSKKRRPLLLADLERRYRERN